jgi:hypothetical protein
MCFLYSNAVPVEVASDLSSNKVGVFLFDDLEIFAVVKLRKTLVFLHAIENDVNYFRKALNFAETFVKALFTDILAYVIVLIEDDVVTQGANLQDSLFELRHLEEFAGDHALAQKGHDAAELFLLKPESLVLALDVVGIEWLLLEYFLNQPHYVIRRRMVVLFDSFDLFLKLAVFLVYLFVEYFDDFVHRLLPSNHAEH